MNPQKLQVVVIGAGYAGLLAAVRLAMKTRDQNVQITLINPIDTFVERLRLHQFAANQPIKQRLIADILNGTDVHFLRGEVNAIHIHQREVLAQTDSGMQRLPYDYLLYTAGSTIDLDCIPGLRQYVYTLNPTGPYSAQALKDALPELNKRGGQLSVVGGGPTGIESAAEFAESYPGLHVSLVTRGELFGPSGRKIQSHIRKTLERLGVSIREWTVITQVEQNSLLTEKGGHIPFDLCLWAGGFAALPLARRSGLAVNGSGQILIDPYMRSISRPEIYAAGDSAQLVEGSGIRIRMAAYTAAITGAHAADNLDRAIRHKPQSPLNFAYLGQGIALGRHESVAFNNFPDDTPKWPTFTGQPGMLGREFFVTLLANLPGIERRLPGLHFWPVPGKVKPRPGPGQSLEPLQK